MRFLDQILAVPGTMFVLLLIARHWRYWGRLLPVSGSSLVGVVAMDFLAAGGGTLSLYGLVVNLPR